MGVTLRQTDRMISPGMPMSLTPHPGEMARLAEMTISQVTENALAVARLFAKEHRSVVVLKGHRTLVASPEGEVFQNTHGDSVRGAKPLLTQRYERNRTRSYSLRRLWS